MFRRSDVSHPDPLSTPLDAALGDVAVNLQLPPSLHDLAQGRYEAVREYAERKGSPLEGRILRFYPQGSMAIDATISTKGTDDEYDLDIVAELDEDPLADPQEVLDKLAEALADYPVSRNVERQTRCVTVRYADGMHLDVTPAVQLPNGAERESHIFHSKPGAPAALNMHVPMNAWGFGAWFRDCTPLEMNFAEAMHQRLLKAHGIVLREAEVDEVPRQTPFIIKNTATVGLQLLKRVRNIAYINATGRIPPSVMMSCIAGHTASPGTLLSDATIKQARTIAQVLRDASARREKVSIVNPIYSRDCFTDRWPETIGQQDAFASLMKRFADDLEDLQRRDISLEDLQDRLRRWFGDQVVSRSIRQLNERMGEAVKSATRRFSPRGGLFVPSAPSIITAGASALASTSAARAHTFMGGRRG